MLSVQHYQCLKYAAEMRHAPHTTIAALSHFMLHLSFLSPFSPNTSPIFLTPAVDYHHIQSYHTTPHYTLRKGQFILKKKKNQIRPSANSLSAPLWE